MDDDLIQKFEKLIDKNDKNTTALLNELKQKARSGKLTFRDVEKLPLCPIFFSKFIETFLLFSQHITEN